MSQDSPENPILEVRKKEAQKVGQSGFTSSKSQALERCPLLSIKLSECDPWAETLPFLKILNTSSLGNNNSICELFNHDHCTMLSAMQKYAASNFLSSQQCYVEGTIIHYSCFTDVTTCSGLHSYHVAEPRFEPMFVWVHGSCFYSRLYCF